MVVQTIRSGSGSTGKKFLFWMGAIGVLFGKIAGFVSSTVAWPAVIFLALVGTIFDASPTGKG